MIKIIRLKKADSKVLKDANTLFYHLTSNAKSASLKELRAMVASPNVEWWFAIDENRVIGMGILVTFLKSIGIAAQIQEMVVNEKYRGKGVGKLLTDKLIERAKVHKATHIDLTSNPSRTDAHKFYEKFGFKKRDTNVYRLKL
mgnify:CR=1 FL=1